MEKVEQYKQNLWMFVFSEFVIFVSQIAIFFMVAVFTSNFLSSEEKMVAFTAQNIKEGWVGTLFLTIIAILVIVGFLSALKLTFENKHIEYFINNILIEIPKTIYTLGSATTGTMLAMSLFIYLHPTEEVNVEVFAMISVLFALVIFIYGCLLSYAFKRKTHILQKPTN